MDVTPFKMSAKFAEKIIRETARDSSRVYIPDPPNVGAWEATVTVRQVHRCLEDGVIVGIPILNEHGHWKCVLKRYAVGVEIQVTAIVMKDGRDWEIFVTEVIKP